MGLHESVTEMSPFVPTERQMEDQDVKVSAHTEPQESVGDKIRVQVDIWKNAVAKVEGREGQSSA